MDTLTNTTTTGIKAADCRSETHRILVCKTCKHTGSACHPGYVLITRLRMAIAAVGDAVLDDFEVSGMASTTDCGRDCTMAYRASRRTAYLFGDIDSDQNIDKLVDYAKQYRQLEDSGCLPVDCASEPHTVTPNHMPAAMIVTTASTMPVA